jgi:hypothetical protein
MGPGKMAAQVRLIALPAMEPAVSSGDRKRECSPMPDAMERESLSDSGDEGEKLG